METIRSAIPAVNNSFGHQLRFAPTRGFVLLSVSDNLIVTPLPSPSSFSFLKELNVSLNDIEEKEETIRETEALALLKAFLTSSSALNNCFKSSGNQKLDKRYDIIWLVVWNQFPWQALDSLGGLQLNPGHFFSKEPKLILEYSFPVNPRQPSDYAMPINPVLTPPRFCYAPTGI
ncbi:unnamed protein product [Fraxinus pennsylvanica]|uniref:Uncharacterized protein n=1 Tax=Fraxinus pennsylvanica TaxID=56036 RepID=A0AAD2A1F3_9LAMI|nr:unnamed protein product [Fraxinus pennsylvanica]